MLALFYRLRTFCNYVCPISGFLSLYTMTATVELRSADKDTCLKCKTKSCIRGSEQGWSCPWNVYMGKLDRNNYCGLCFECVKSCPNDNISLFVRPFSSSDVILRGYDEVWKACIMVVLPTRSAKSRLFQLSCAARSAPTFFEAIMLSPSFRRAESGRVAKLARCE